MAKRADRFVIIGGGRVGTAVGHILQHKGERVTTVASRSDASLETVEKYIRVIFSKLNVTSRVEAAVYAVQKKLI